MKKHPLDIFSLIFGVFFLALGLAFLLPATGEQLAESLQQVFSWGGPVLVIAAGLALLLPSLRRREKVAPPEELEDSDLDLSF